MQPSDLLRACRQMALSMPRRHLRRSTLPRLRASKRRSMPPQAPQRPLHPGPGFKEAANGTCSKVGVDENLCVSHMSKDSSSVVEARLLRTGDSAVVVDVAASNGKGLTTADQGELPSDATMMAIAEAVAAHF